MRVAVVYARLERQHVFELELAPQARVADALAAVAQESAMNNVDMDSATVGIWGKVCSRDQMLEDGDRVEIYRPLPIDPMEHRRSRARRQKEAGSSES